MSVRSRSNGRDQSLEMKGMGVKSMGALTACGLRRAALAAATQEDVDWVIPWETISGPR